MSYPDLVEQDGKFYLTETQKNVGRVHDLPAALVSGLFNQFDHAQVATANLVLNLAAPSALKPEVPMPRLPDFHTRDNRRPDHGDRDMRAGFSVDLWLKPEALPAGTALLDTRTPEGQGLLVTTTPAGTIRLSLHDGRQETNWECDRGLLAPGASHHVVITVDGGPKIITFVVDGVLCDGGNERQFGWGRFSPTLRSANGAAILRISPALASLRVYSRALRTSEAVGNFRAGNGLP
ncbi:MAG: hypothetical protein NTV51_07960 [Verrucomicrobia bacterium]|nr:hypothetical protein [Verrucomicrobiota bacterium]